MLYKKFTKEELGFILYNNRSKSVVRNFLPKNINKYRLLNIEDIFEKSKNKFINTNKMVEININELELNKPDIIIEKSDLSNLTNDLYKYVGVFDEKESKFLSNRGINKEIIEKWKLCGLSNFGGRELEVIGASLHPILSNVLEDGTEGGGIVFPLFKDGVLINTAIRKISLENTNKASLKYSLACPDVSVWKSESIIEGDEIWITEGLFDMFALDKNGYKCVTCSSAMWSGIQLYEVIMMRPSKVNIFSDNDEVGIRTSLVLSDFFKEYGLESEVFISSSSKDASEHFFEKSLSDDDLLNISDFELSDIREDSSFDFINYLKNRKY